MKKSISVLTVAISALLTAQKIEIKTDPSLYNQEAFLYTYSGSKDIATDRQKVSSTGTLNFNLKDGYHGMLRLYFPSKNISTNLISEGQPISASINAGSKPIEIQYADKANQMMEAYQSKLSKQELILPALKQIAVYYRPQSEFGQALSKEISNLSAPEAVASSQFTFLPFYQSAYEKFAKKATEGSKLPAPTEYISFVNSAGEQLETSGLLRQILLNYLSSGENPNIDKSVDDMMASVKYESPRGQTVLSEFIDIFDTYGMAEQKNKYLSKAENLKCTINSRLSSTIAANKNTAIGATFADYTFNNPVNTAAKSIHKVNADKKVVVFWSSTCSHCEAELPTFITPYQKMKAQNIEIIGLSLDTDQAKFSEKARIFPWINDTELRGWNSTFADTYNVKGTPTYFILDRNNRIIAKPDHAKDVLEYLKIQ